LLLKCHSARNPGSGALFASAVFSPFLHALAMAAPLALTPSLEDEDKKDYDLPSTEEPLKQTRVNKYFGTSEVVQPRTLKSRHLVLISIGGTIGTGKLSSSAKRIVRNETGLTCRSTAGIFFSLGSSVATAGAGGALVAYILVGEQTSSYSCEAEEELTISLFLPFVFPTTCRPVLSRSRPASRRNERFHPCQRLLLDLWHSLREPCAG